VLENIIVRNNHVQSSQLYGTEILLCHASRQHFKADTSNVVSKAAINKSLTDLRNQTCYTLIEQTIVVKYKTDTAHVSRQAGRSGSAGRRLTFDGQSELCPAKPDLVSWDDSH